MFDIQHFFRRPNILMQLTFLAKLNKDVVAVSTGQVFIKGQILDHMVFSYKSHIHSHIVLSVRWLTA